MKTKLLSVLFVLIYLGSCKNQPANDAGSNDANVSENRTEAVNEASKGKYGIKSGSVVYNTQMMGMDVVQTLMFDDYGKKEISEMKMEMMGTTIHTVIITKDGFIYTLDMVAKTGNKAPVPTVNNANIDFRNLTDEMIKDMNLKKEGHEEFLGINCEKMSIDYTKMNMKGTFLVYEGVALKSDTYLGTMNMKLAAESFVENPQIPAEKFEVPAGFTITGNNE